ncbi:hypothetical protein WG929_15200 [Oceanobacter sp. wDCs-4]|uniref:Abi-like protein n=1 Tax=Oceanobacter antarcticus TaxID=3133425 RepID=A0ABW8NLA5_9GAMM
MTTFSHKELVNIPKTLSQPRFATYLQHCGNDKERALVLYKWNLEVSSAFLIPLHMLEVSTRNAVVEAIEAVHTANWPWNNGFIRSLTNPQVGYSPKRDLMAVAGREPTMGKVVAELKFVFWERMFTSRHDNRLWNQHIKASFPFAPTNDTAQQIRASLYNDIFTIRELRNRIAHHEPIFSRNLQADYDNILKIVGWRDDATAAWMDGFQTVTELIRTKP